MKWGVVMFPIYVFKSRKGSVLIWMLIAFTVLMILMTSIFYLVRQDIFETAMQEERLQTYYIALAGIDLTYAGLMDPNFEPKKLETAIAKLKFNGNVPLSDSIVIEDDETMGTANITIKRVTKDEKDWLQITSIGKATGKNTEVTTTMRINEANPNQIVREKFGN